MKTVDIWFINLGIKFSNWHKSFSIGGFSIYFYGCIIAIAVLAGLKMAQHVAKKTGQNPEDYLDLALWAVVFGIVGARIYYVVFAWDMYKNDLKQIFNTRQGGLAIYGGIIAAVITTYIFCRKKKMSFLTMADTASVGLVTGQCVGRWSNFFNMEAFGGYTNNLLAMRLNIAKVNPGMISQDLLDKAIVENGVTYIQVHPTFFYESCWNLCLLILLLNTRKTARFKGEMFLRYLAGYGLGRIWIEGLRTDQLILFNTGLAVSQVLSGIIFAGAVIAIIIGRKRAGKVSAEQKDR